MKNGLKSLVVLGMSLATLASCNTGANTGINVGLMTLHNSDSTYDKNFIDAFKKAAELENVKAVLTDGIDETAAVTSAATDLAEDGCKFIFADSFGHETYLMSSAEQYPNVQFGHATGTHAHTSSLTNFGNAFASIYEGRYLAGVAAGLKLQEMITNKALPASAKMDGENYKIGYVGAFTYAEVISGYTSFFLGVQSVVSNVTMDVQFTGSWYDESGEKSAAELLISRGCAIISQHADSWGAPTACETAGVPNVTYNGSTESRCPNTYVISSKVNWIPYFRHAFQATKEGKTLEKDYYGTLNADALYDDDDNAGSVALSKPGAKGAAAGTDAKLKEVAAKLANGTLQVFDTSKFTVTKGDNKNVNATVDANGHLTGYMADVDTDANYTPDHEAIASKNGITYFAESSLRSAPYFDVQIDGINLLNTK